MQVENIVETSMPVNIVVAHALEAKALIAMFSLEQTTGCNEFPLYAHSNGMRLIVAGIGKESMARAVNSLAASQSGEESQIRGWLNIGICGHHSAALGSIWLANKILDEASGKRMYPPQLISAAPPMGVITVDEPENEYPLDGVYEMEASAFFDAACRHAPAEVVQLLKIVSDNIENPISGLDLKNVPLWMRQNEESIVALQQGLSEIVRAYNNCHELPSAYYTISRQLRLSVSHKLQLKRLCQRYRALGREAELDRMAAANDRGGRQLLLVLRERLEDPDTLTIAN